MSEEARSLLVSDGVIGFRRPESCDVAQYLQLRNNLSLAAKLMGHRLGVGEEGIRAWIARVATSVDEIVFTAVLIHDDHRPLGYVKIFRIDPYAKTAWIGLSLFDERQSGAGYGSKMLSLMCTYLRDQLACRKVSLEVTEDNGIALHVYQKQGFEIEGRMKDQFFVNGRYLDVLILSRFLT